MKISVFSFAVNDKFPIDIMNRQYLKHLKEDFELILFNDAIDHQMEKNINEICFYNNIKTVRIPQHIHKVQNPSESYATALNWVTQVYAKQNNCEIIVLVHADIFPIQDVKISEILKSNMVASTSEIKFRDNEQIIYFYPAFTIINLWLINDVKELDFGLEIGLDTGGKTKEFVKKYKNLIKFLENKQVSNLLNDITDPKLLEYIKYDMEICSQHNLSAGWIAEGFYHYLAGSQWNSDNSVAAEGHKKRMELFLKYFY